MSKIVGSNMRDGFRGRIPLEVWETSHKNQAENTSVLPLLQYTFSMIFFSD